MRVTSEGTEASDIAVLAPGDMSREKGKGEAFSSFFSSAEGRFSLTDKHFSESCNPLKAENKNNGSP